jgi:hypothetical protein
MENNHTRLDPDDYENVFEPHQRKKGKRARYSGVKVRPREVDAKLEAVRLTREKIEKAERRIASVVPFLFKDIPPAERTKRKDEVIRTYAGWVSTSLTTNRAVLNQIDLTEVGGEGEKVTLEHAPTRFRASGYDRGHAENELRKALNAHTKNWSTVAVGSRDPMSIARTIESIALKNSIDLP